MLSEIFRAAYDKPDWIASKLMATCQPSCKNIRYSTMLPQ